MILAIETSCDDTCAAIMKSDALLSSVVSSQTDFHARYGGIVPEVASRRHLELINPVIDAALKQADARLNQVSRVAVTTSPGLIGALLVGVATAKAIAWACGAEMTAVNHLEGHIAANYLAPDPMEPPFICLIASGGHTSIVFVPGRGSFEVVGQTLDDAAGEALDKGARLLGLAYPGGAELDDLARDGDPGYHQFPVALSRPDNLDFSFSGIKTSLFYYLRAAGKEEIQKHRADIAASYQSAVVSSLIDKTLAAAGLLGCRQICLSGGVSANSELRRRLADACAGRNIGLRIPPPELCTDNAAMIASAARFLPAMPVDDFLRMGAIASGGFAKGGKHARRWKPVT
ncbi:MAG: tRNA (adenosine(37)-N6)-threonylcarbamoyltransferase complex transferase subunit TsaD [Thermoleophilia bacterium]|nr:tRNA (adenosine(37)-N6)-threonylcarbamoyltransferase complex transferase subunit TsaD [Thermoleophilia bacterium]